MKSFYKRSDTFIFIALFIIAFGVRLFCIIYFKFDGLYGQDAYAYAEYSKLFYNSIINFKVPPNFYWPIGFYFFSTIFSLVTAGKTALSSLLVSLNAGALTAGFMFLLCYEVIRRYYSDGKAKKYSFAAGLIICFAGITTKQSVVIMSDSLGLLFITISALYLIKYLNEQNRRYLVFCFSAFSLGLITRYANGLFIPVIIPVLFSVYRNSKDKKQISFDILLGTIIGFIIFLPQLLYIIKFGIPYFQYKGEAPTWSASWSPLNIFRSDFATFDGTQHYRFINGIFYSSPVFHPLFLSLFGLSFLFGFFKSFKKMRGVVLIFLLSWIAVYVIYLSGNPFQSIRYTLSFFPPLIILSVFGVAEINIKQIYKSLFIIIGLLLITGYSFYDFSKFAERKSKEMECVEWLQKNVQPGSNVFTFEITGAVNYYTGLNAKEYFNYNYSDIKQLTDTTKEKTYMLLPVERINKQWKGLPIEKSFDSAKTNLIPVSIGKVNDYEGFLIEK